MRTYISDAADLTNVSCFAFAGACGWYAGGPMVGSISVTIAVVLLAVWVAKRASLKTILRYSASGFVITTAASAFIAPGVFVVLATTLAVAMFVVGVFATVKTIFLD